MTDLAIRLYDTSIQSLPDDLYIPPKAFAIWLEQFEGPLDFLLYLVKKNNFDITTTAILPITQQYLTYIEQLKDSHFELAGDYLLMASTLIAIKSELLLPKPTPALDDKSPTKALIRRLEDYAQIKHATHRLNALVRLERDVFSAYASLPDPEIRKQHLPPYPAKLLSNALIKLQKNTRQTHHIVADTVPLAERLVAIIGYLSTKKRANFSDILDKRQGKLGVVVSFIAILELIKQQRLAVQCDDGTTPITLIWQG